MCEDNLQNITLISHDYNIINLLNSFCKPTPSLKTFRLCFNFNLSKIIIHFQANINFLPCPMFDTKLHPVVRFQFWNFGEVWNQPFVATRSNLTRGVALIRVPSPDQKHCEELLLLLGPWSHIITCKSFVLYRNT